MITISKKEYCCGCSACANICPHTALTMKVDKKGFLYPSVDLSKCNNCGICEKVCPILHEDEERSPSNAYFFINKNEDTRLKSSSGGLFSALAEHIIEKGGIVYGAAFDEQWTVHHVAITQKEDLSKLRGSKYVQSTIGTIYQDVKKQLGKGKKVLFTGTPCQVAGLRHYLHKDSASLITLDFACHGVPNPRIWKDYLREETHTRSKFLNSDNQTTTIKDIEFRNKVDGWKNYHFVIRFNNGGTGKDAETDMSIHHRYHPFMNLFLDNYILRPSCLSCRFRKGKSGATYTCADSWGIHKIAPQVDDDKGTSLFFDYTCSNTMVPVLKECNTIIQVPVEKAMEGNPALVKDWSKNHYSGLFYLLHDKLSLNIVNSWKVCRKIESTFGKAYYLFTPKSQERR